MACADVCAARRASLDELAQPFEAVCVAHALHHRAHKNFDGPRARVLLGCILAIGLVMRKAENVSELVLHYRVLHVNLVSENHEGYVLQFGHLEQRFKFALAFFNAVSVSCVNHENDAVHRAAVFAPGLAGLQVTAQVVRIELDVSNCDFRLVRVDR